ncbi:hypothetical protein [Streptomyces goshikiensis]
MIKMAWALVAEHLDEWTGDDVERGAAVIEDKVGAVVDASGMPQGAIQH